MKLKLKSYLILLISVMCIPFFAQNKTMDSLKLALKNAKHDTTRCNILNILIEKENDLSLAAIYNSEIINICEINLKKINSYHPHYIVFKKNYANAFSITATIAEQENDEDKALEYYLKSLKILEEINNKKLIAIVLNNLAIIYHKKGTIPLALKFNYRSLKIKEGLNDKLGMGYSLNNIGLIYNNQGESNMALIYYSKSLKLLEEINYMEGVVLCIINIGSIYKKQNNLPKALEYFNRSLTIADSINDKINMAYSLYHLGSIYSKDNSIDKSLEYYNKSLNISEGINNKYLISINIADIGFLYLTHNDYVKSLEYTSRSMRLSQELGYPKEIAKAAIRLNTIYKHNGNYKAALENYELYIQMHDSISNNETRKASIKSQLKYEYEKKAAADSVKVAEEKKLTTVKLKQEQTQRYFLYGGLGLTALFGIFMFNRFRITQKQKNVIEEQKIVVENQKHIVDEKQKEILDSIRYAKRIQQSLMPTEKFIERILKNNKS